jgi:hypothetical protein
MLAKHGSARRMYRKIESNFDFSLMCPLCILVWSVMDQESSIPKGYHALFDEKLLNDSYQERADLFGDKRLGVVLADKNRTHSTIVLRAENAAEVLYHEPIQDVTTMALKVIEFAKTHDVPISDENIFIDKVDRGQELCNLLRQLAVGHFNINKYGNRQRYGITMNEQPQFDSNLFADNWARAYSKLAGWLRIGKLVGRHVFDDLLYMVYTDTNGKRKMIDRETLMEEGIDSSIPDALVLTIAKDKRIIQRPARQCNLYILLSKPRTVKSLPLKIGIEKIAGIIRSNEL